MATDTIENPDVLIAGELFKEPTSFQRNGSRPVTFRAMRHKSDAWRVHYRIVQHVVSPQRRSNRTSSSRSPAHLARQLAAPRPNTEPAETGESQLIREALLGRRR